VQFFELKGDAYQGFSCSRVSDFAADGSGKSVKEGEKEEDYISSLDMFFFGFMQGRNYPPGYAPPIVRSPPAA
jgi:hypothetical protein